MTIKLNVANNSKPKEFFVDQFQDIIDDTDEGSAQQDVGFIFAGQKAEHYEIATYGGLALLATTPGYSEAAEKLERTLTEEKQADVLLTHSGMSY